MADSILFLCGMLVPRLPQENSGHKKCVLQTLDDCGFASSVCGLLCLFVAMFVWCLIFVLVGLQIITTLQLTNGGLQPVPVQLLWPSFPGALGRA